MKIGYLMQEGGPDVRQEQLTGPANHVYQVIKELKELGHEVCLLARYEGVIWKSDNLKEFHPIIEDRSKRRFLHLFERIVRRTQTTLKLPYLNWFESMRYARLCQKELAGFDLLYERMGWMGYGGGYVARKLGIHLILEANNGDHITELKMLGHAPNGLQLWISLQLMKWSVKRASHIIATGEGHRYRFMEHWGTPPEKISVVENGSELVGILQRNQLKSFNHSICKKTKLVFVGAFEPWHGISILLEAVANIKALGYEIELFLIGSGTELENIKKKIQELEIESQVILTGHLDVHQYAQYLANGDIGLSPYCGWMEFSGLKLFDYKAAGLAIVASGLDGQPTTLRNEETALIVPPCEPEALTQAIIRLITEVDLRCQLGRTARIESEQKHSWMHTSINLENIFKSIISS